MVSKRASGSGSDMQLLAQLLSRAERRLRRGLERVLEADGSSVEQWRALILLADGESHSMSEIAESALLSPPSLTRLIDRMVADNLAYRTADAVDRRRVLVRITQRGLALHAQLTQRLDDEQDEILADADATETAQLAALLTALANRRP